MIKDNSTHINLGTITPKGTQFGRAPRVLLAAGGTGGHVYPAIAIAEALKAMEQSTEILFVGTNNHMEWDAVPAAGFSIEPIWISGFQRRMTIKNLSFPLKLVVSSLQSWKILRHFKPDAVISCGGYAAGPIGWVAAKRNIPLFIQEQNSYPGITNRMLSGYAELVFTAFEQVKQHFPDPNRIRFKGNPTREALKVSDKNKAYSYFNFDDNKRTILVFGGSGGARTINEATLEHLRFLHDELDLQIIWQCGQKYDSWIRRQLDLSLYPKLKLLPYIDRMDLAYTVADLVISRAGAISCSELNLTHKPSILIPSPHVAENHQHKNAKAMEEARAAILLEDYNAIEQLGDRVNDVIYNNDALKSMSKGAKSLARPNAALEIAQEIIAHIKQNKFN